MMRAVTLRGTLTSTSTLEVFGHPIKVEHPPRKCVGKRVEVEGYICFNAELGAFLQVTKCTPTSLPDLNKVTIHGSIVGTLPVKDHDRHSKTTCVLLQQSKSRSSRVLVTIPKYLFHKAGLDNLSIGSNFTATGYVGYHARGLHVFFQRREE